jgi:ABC-type oligopeptide transport system ATPase subunit
MGEDILRLSHLTKTFPVSGAGGGFADNVGEKTAPGTSRKTIKALDNVSLTVKKQEILGLVGESGSGKSTLSRLAMRLTEPDSGKIYLDHVEISGMNRRQLQPYRRKMQMVFQNPLASFNPRRKIGAALQEICAFYRFPAADTAEKIDTLLAEVGIRRDILSRYPAELSGGQLQRLAIVRALLCGPELLIADEPVSALDVSIQAQLLNLLNELRTRFKLSIVFISHDMSVIEYLCDRVAVLYQGRIVEEGPVSKVFYQPEDPYTKRLIAAAPRLDRFVDRAGYRHTASHAEGARRNF